MRRYLFLVSFSYSFPVMRPVQQAIKARGEDVAWFFDEQGINQYLRNDERELKSVREVMEYNPDVVFTTNRDMYDFFPGMKVMIFHGFNINKRNHGNTNSHVNMKNLCDLYCAPDTKTYQAYESLRKKCECFKVEFTGWSKIDNFFEPDGTMPLPVNKRPVVLYTSTFTKWITSTNFLFDQIERLATTQEWDWIITFHPKMDSKIVARYKELAARHDNISFIDTDNNVELLKKADVMVCDTSSIIIEFLYFFKPVVTFRNTIPGKQLIDIQEPEELEAAIKRALSRPEELIREIKSYIQEIHPFRDGRSSERVLAAIDGFVDRYKTELRSKPLNLFRKWKVRKKLGYFPLWEKLKGNQPKHK